LAALYTPPAVAALRRIRLLVEGDSRGATLLAYRT
jgi:hypothetical protein